jgi:hypothetical protein
MTSMEVLAVRSNGEVVNYDEAHNSWGGAMHIWMMLSEKYRIQVRFSMTGFNELWRRIDEMAEPDQWVMASTFDKFIVPKEHLPTLIKHWKDFYDRHPTDTMAQGISILKRASDDSEVTGICFNMTSIVDSWRVPVDDEEGGSRSYNINQDTGHKLLTPEYIQGLKEQAG